MARVLLLERDLNNLDLEIRRPPPPPLPEPPEEEEAAAAAAGAGAGPCDVVVEEAGSGPAVLEAVAEEGCSPPGPPPPLLPPPPVLPLGDARKCAMLELLAPGAPDTLPEDPYNGRTLDEDLDFCITTISPAHILVIKHHERT